MTNVASIKQARLARELRDAVARHALENAGTLAAQMIDHAFMQRRQRRIRLSDAEIRELCRVARVLWDLER